MKPAPTPAMAQPVEHDPFAGPVFVKVLATTLAQRGMWYSGRLRPDAAHGHHAALGWALHGELDQAALHAALADLVPRFEALRARISADGSQILIAAQGELAPETVRLPPGETAEAALAAAAAQPFDLEGPSLARASLVLRGAAPPCLVLAMHRIAGDDGTLRVIGHALVQAYERLAGAGRLAWRPLAGAAGAPAAGPAAIAVRGSGSQPPLFLVHDGDGNHSYAWALAPFVDQDVPVYALPGVGLDETSPRTQQGLVARLRRMVYAIQPAGPYRLAGFCDGGVTAYELALQLLGDNQEVTFLGMFNTHFFPLRERQSAQVSSRDVLLGAALAAARRGPGGAEAAARVEALFAANEGQSVPALLRALRAADLAPDDLDGLTTGQAERSVDHACVLLRATEFDYASFPISVPVHYFLAAEGEAQAGVRGWDAVLEAGQTTLVPVPATQDDMLRRPHVEEVGRTLSRALAQAAGRRSSESSYDPLVPLQAGRAGHPPLFCVPGAGANVVSFYEMLDGLDPDCPVYGLQPRGLDGRLAPHTSVEAAAACYLDALLDAYPSGPVHLMGHSFGGWVVYAMAARLQAAGRRVASLTLIDSEPPQPEAIEYGHTEVMLQLVDIFEQMAEQSFGITADALADRTEPQQRALLHQKLVAAGVLPSRSTPDILTGPVRTFASCMRAAYVPERSYDGTLHLVLLDDPRLDAGRQAHEYRRRLEGWREHAAALSCLRGPGNHMTALKQPHVRAIVAWLRASWSGRDA
jgi:arthrofactin-type cyclic lipopeptide synthetase C